MISKKFLLYVFKKSDLLIPSFLKSDVSKLLKSLLTKERLWANRSGCSPKWANEWIAHSLIISQKMSDLLRKPMKNFQTLQVELTIYDYSKLSWIATAKKRTFFAVH